MIEKPTMFFSHSGMDKAAIGTLKELFMEKTGGCIDVFLSSDGQSIPFGKNWVYSIQEALKRARLMIVFLTPNSVASNWVYFEAGYSYAKDIRVVPVGLFGVDLRQLSPPLSLLQGFNVSSAEGLGNIIALANEEFQYTHDTAFTSDEFNAVCGECRTAAQVTFAEFVPFVAKLALDVDGGGEHFRAAVSFWDTERTEYVKFGERRIDLQGISMELDDEGGKPTIQFMIEPTIADVALPMISRVLKSVKPVGIKGSELTIVFNDAVRGTDDLYRQSGLLHGLDVKLGGEHWLVMGNLRFSVGRGAFVRPGRIHPSPWHLSIEFVDDEIPLGHIGELLTVLFQRGVFKIEPDAMA